MMAILVEQVLFISIEIYMQEYWEYEDNDDKTQGDSDIQDALIDNLENKEDDRDSSDYMKAYNIKLIKGIAKKYYGIAEIKKMETYINDWNLGCLYTLITYEWEDILLCIGMGDFTQEMFTRKDVLEYRWLTHSPLKLFVTTARARENNKDSDPKNFLDQFATLYAPKGGEIVVRNIHLQQAINYWESLGIVVYKDALFTLRNAEIHKVFSHEHEFDRFCNKIQELKGCTYEDIHKRSTIKDVFHSLAEEDREFNIKFFDCLMILSGENKKNMYNLIKSFSCTEKQFTKTNH